MSFLSHLRFKRRKTVREHAQLMGVSERTVYRYIETLEQHFLIDKDEYERYFIHTDIDEDEIRIKLTAEELQFLYNLVSKSKSKLKEGLQAKLDLNLRIELNEDDDHASKIDVLESAINSRKKVKLEKYTAASSVTPKAKIVEPISITEFKYLTAYDVESGNTKIYAISRISGVVPMDEAMENEEEHRYLKPDIFGMSGGKAFNIHLKLKNRAYLLMREEFPRSVEFLKKAEDPYFPYELKCWVYGLEGIGRYALGMLDHIRIIENEALKDYIMSKIRLFGE